MPYPGATTHPNAPYLLGDGSVWLKQSHALATLFVSTNESTSSVTYVDLATPDSITFTLDEARNVLVEYLAYAFNSVAGNICYNEQFLDGVGQGLTEAGIAMPFASNAQPLPNATIYSALAAGSHTISVQHRVSAGTGNWLRRLLKISLIP